MGQEILVISIINWILGIVALLCTLTLLIFPIATIIAAIIEGSKPLSEGGKRSWKKTKIFGILAAIGFFGLIAVLVVWGVAVYIVQIALATT